MCCLALLLTTNLQCKALGPRRIRLSSPGLRRTSTGWRCTGRRSDTGTVRTLRTSGLKQKIRLFRQSMFRWHGGWEHASHTSGRGFKASCGCSAVVEHLACTLEVMGSNNHWVPGLFIFLSLHLSGSSSVAVHYNEIRSKASKVKDSERQKWSYFFIFLVFS